MTRTWFRVPSSESRRLTTNYFILAGVPIPVDQGVNSVFSDEPPFPMGGAGLVSSPRDYDRFLAMLTGFGRIEGRRVMSEASVRLGTSNLLPPGAVVRDSRVAGAGFGAGGRVGRGEQAGTFGWGGAAGTIAFADLSRSLRAGLYTQYMPVNAYAVHQDFPLAVMADVRGHRAA
jgi:CubicO group peptidase (beta-lactamase class C family)